MKFTANHIVNHMNYLIKHLIKHHYNFDNSPASSSPEAHHTQQVLDTRSVDGVTIEKCHGIFRDRDL